MHMIHFNLFTNKRIFKKIFQSVLVLILIPNVFPITALACTESQERLPVTNEVYINNDIGYFEKINVQKGAGDSYQILMTSIPDTTNNSNDICESRSLLVLANSECEKDSIVSTLLSSNHLGSIPDEKYFLGNSCYIYVCSYFSTKKIGIQKYYRIEKVTTKYSVNSGTSIKSASLLLVCKGSDTNSNSVNKQKRITVTKSSYATTLTSSWPYIVKNSQLLGAQFTVTAKRPSGSSKTASISANVIE